MVKDIVKDVMFLGLKSEPTTKADIQIEQDLRDTLAAHRSGCVGMAANMIGYRKRTIIVSVGLGDLVMHNPVIVSKSGEYETEEGCLSLLLAGERRSDTKKSRLLIRIRIFKKESRSSMGMLRRLCSMKWIISRGLSYESGNDECVV